MAHEPTTARPPALFSATLRTWLFWLALIGFTVLVYYWISKRIWDVELSLEPIRQGNWGLFAAAVALSTLNPVLAAWRWHLLLRAMDVNIAFRHSLQALFAANPINLFTPSRSGDVYRAFVLRERLAWTDNLGSIGVERVLGMVVVTSIGLVASLVLGLTEQSWGIGLLFLAEMAAIAVLFIIHLERWPLPERIKTKLAAILSAMTRILRRPGYLAAAFAISLIHWLLIIVVCTLFLSGLSDGFPFLMLCGAIPLGALVGMLPLTFSGMGTRDAVLLALLAGVVPEEHILWLGLFYALIFYLYVGLLGLPSLLFSIRRGKI